MSRITMQDTGMSAMVKMADGNPGALTAMMEIIRDHESIDPQAMMGGIGAIMILDTWEIYGTDIYVLWNDQCNRDTRKMLMIMRATQMGFFPHTRLQQIAGDQMRQFVLSDEKLTDLDKQVCEALPRFKRPDEAIIDDANTEMDIDDDLGDVGDK